MNAGVDSARLGGGETVVMWGVGAVGCRAAKLHCMHACVGNGSASYMWGVARPMPFTLCLAHHVANGSGELCVENGDSVPSACGLFLF